MKSKTSQSDARRLSWGGLATLKEKTMSKLGAEYWRRHNQERNKEDAQITYTTFRLHSTTFERKSLKYLTIVR